MNERPRSYLPGAGFMDASDAKHFQALAEAQPENIDYQPLEHDSQYCLNHLRQVDAAMKRRDRDIVDAAKALEEASNGTSFWKSVGLGIVVAGGILGGAVSLHYLTEFMQDFLDFAGRLAQ